MEGEGLTSSTAAATRGQQDPSLFTVNRENKPVTGEEVKSVWRQRGDDEGADEEERDRRREKVFERDRERGRASREPFIDLLDY